MKSKGTMKMRSWIAGVLMISVLWMAGAGLAADNVLKMSTTTSTEASGLLDVLLPAFEKDTGIKVEVVAKGTGAALRDGMDGNVDIIFVHARAREDQFVAEGYGTRRYGVMHNDFVLAGPPDDPAGVKGGSDAARTMAMIAAKGAMFISRGDDSGTHTKEQTLWKQSGVAIKTVATELVKDGKRTEIKHLMPDNADAWYRSIGQGMGKTLAYADEKKAYTLADRGTFLQYRYGKQPPIDLDILVQGGADLANPYGLIPVNPAKFPHARHDLAETFAQWIISAKGQGVIRDYKVLGKQLFFPDVLS